MKVIDKGRVVLLQPDGKNNFGIEINKLNNILTWVDTEKDKVTSHLYVDSEGNYSTYKGYVHLFDNLGIEHDFKFPVREDIPEVPKDLFPNIELFDFQIQCIKKNYLRYGGINNIKTGGGKSLIILGLVKTYWKYQGKKDVIIVVPSNILMKQFYETALSVGFTKDEIGRFGDGYKDGITKPLTIGIINSFNSSRKSNNKLFLDKIEKTDMLIYDEAHHTKASSYVELALLCNAETFCLFSGTPFSNDSNPLSNPEDALILGLAGKVITNITNKYLIDIGRIAQPFVYIHNWYKGQFFKYPGNYINLYKRYIVNQKQRNENIISLAKKFEEMGFKSVIFVSLLDHGLELLKMLKSENAMCVYGGENMYECTELGEILNIKMSYETALKMFNSGQKRIMITSSVADEGVDIPSMDIAILASAGKSAIKIKQRGGRVGRSKKNLNVCYIVDFNDSNHIYFKSQGNKRRKIFEEMSSIFIDDEYVFYALLEKHKKYLESV